MKPINDRKMDMGRGPVMSDAFFPEEPHHRPLPRAGEIRGFKYPDTDQMIHRDQDSAVRDTSKNMPKPEFRH